MLRFFLKIRFAAVKSLGFFGMGYLFYRNYEYRRYLIAAGYLDSSGKLVNEGVELPMKPGQSFFNRLKEFHTPNLFEFMLLATAYWGYRSFKAVNGLLERRYADPGYQILRADILREKMRTWMSIAPRVFALPVIFGSSVFWFREDISRFFKESGRLELETPEFAEFSVLRSTLAEIKARSEIPTFLRDLKSS